MRKILLMSESYHKLLKRRVSDMNVQLDLLCSLQALNTMTELARSVMTFTQTSQQAAGIPGFNELQKVGQILSSTSSAVGTTYIASNGQLQVVPPIIPDPTSDVRDSLAAAGLDFTVVSSADPAGVAGVSNAS